MEREEYTRDIINALTMSRIIGGVIVIVLLVGVFFVWQSKRATAPGEPNTPVSTNTATEVPAGIVESGKKVTASIQDAMRQNAPMKCTYSASEGKNSTATEVLVAGEQFVATTRVGGVATHALFDGTTQYIWTSGSKQGMKMSQTCLESFKKTATDQNGSPDKTPQDYRESLDMAKNVQCESTEFDPPIAEQVPKDIAFTDQCAMMQESLKMMEQVKDKMPAGVSIPTLPSGAQPY